MVAIEHECLLIDKNPIQFPYMTELHL